MRVLPLTLVCLALVTGGCVAFVPNVSVSYASYPDGALVLDQHGAILGRTPMTRLRARGELPVNAEGCVDLPPIVLQWQSGARESVDPEPACGWRLTVRAYRPAEVPGLEQDLAVMVAILRTQNPTSPWTPNRTHASEAMKEIARTNPGTHPGEYTRGYE